MVPKLGTCIGDGMMTSRFKARTLDLRDLGAIDLGVPPRHKVDSSGVGEKWFGA